MKKKLGYQVVIDATPSSTIHMDLFGAIYELMGKIPVPKGPGGYYDFSEARIEVYEVKK
jgi:hypothetical protein